MADVLSFDEFAGGKVVSPEGSSSPPTSPGPSAPATNTVSFEDFAGSGTESAYSGFYDKTVKGLKAFGGEAAVLADFVLSVPGFILQTGAQLGGTVQAAARGVPMTADQRQLNPVTAYTVGRQMGQEFGEPVMNPVKKILDAFRSGKAYEDSKSAAGLSKLAEGLDAAGRWVEEATGGVISRDAVPMLADTLMTGAAGLGGKKGGIDPATAARMREALQKVRDQSASDMKAETLTPEEFISRAPVQKQINDLLSIRTPQEQAKVTRTRREDAKQAFSDTGRERALTEDERNQLDVVKARGSRVYDTSGESLFTAEERTAREKSYADAQPKEAPEAEGTAYEIGSRQMSKQVDQSEILRILQKPGFERTADDLIVLRAARQEGKARPDAVMLLSAAGIGAALGASIDDDQLRGALLGGATALGPASLMLGLGKVSSRFKQAGAVKGPGGMWHPAAVERLARPIVDSLARPVRGEGVTPIIAKGAEAEGQWADRAVRNYLNKYAGTERDPLKDTQLPDGDSWGKIVDAVISKETGKNFRARTANDFASQARREEANKGLEGVKDEELLFNIDAFGDQAAQRQLGSYLSHVGDYLRQTVTPEDLPRYDLVRAVKETAENDKRVAKQMEKAAGDSTKQLPVYKEYPDGFRWVELKLPEKLTPEMEKQVRKASVKELKDSVDPWDVEDIKVGDEGYVALGADGKPIKNAFTGEVAAGSGPSEAWLAGRLAEEGNAMGHCVGGYCEGVAAGDSRIFSLRDGKGKSHVTVEVEPQARLRWDVVGEATKNNLLDKFDATAASRAEEGRYTLGDFLQEYHPSVWEKVKPEGKSSEDVLQIKGKQNRAPNAEYLPYVQDFVRGGKWGEVGDLEHTGLWKSGKEYLTDADVLKRAEKLSKESGGVYVKVSQADLNAYKQGGLRVSGEGRTINEALNLGTRDYKAGRHGERGEISQEMVVGLTGLGLGGLFGWAMSDDPSGALLGAVAGASLGLPGARARIVQAVELADHGIGNLSSRIGEISAPLKLRAREYEHLVLEQSYQDLHKVVPLMRELNKLGDGKRMEIERALLTGDPARVADLMKGNVPLVSAWRETKNVLQDLGQRLQGHGRFKTMLDDYFPRLVRDVEGLKEVLGVEDRTRLEQALAVADKRAVKDRGTPLSSIEQSAIINREIQGFRRAKGYQPGYAKTRGVQDVTADIQPFYHTASESLYVYIRGAIQDLELARFFGRDLVQTDIGAQKHTNIEASIGNVVGRELQAGKIDHAQAQDLIKMFQSRFQSGERSPHRLVQEVRNLGNLGLLGNVVSAITQMSDTAMAIYAQDLRSTLTAIAKQVSGRERVTARDFGLADHIAEEFVSQTKTAEWLNKMFKYSGFAGIDRFGKTTHLNAALIRAERLSKTPGGMKALEAEYGAAFGDEFPALLSDLRHSSLTPRVRAYLFSELSDMQPISKLEMPQGYLDNPNGRLLYMLKSFMLKQVDVVRRDGLGEMRRGNVVKGLKNMTEYGLVLGISGATTQMLQDWIMGREVHFDAGDVLENTLKTFGWGEYVRDKAARGEFFGATMGIVAPPYKMMDDIIRRDPRAVQYIPLVGKLYYSWELGGKEAAEIARKKKTGEELSDEALEYRRSRRERAREKREAR